MCLEGERVILRIIHRFNCIEINCKTFVYIQRFCVGDAKFVQEIRVECVVFKMLFYKCISLTLKVKYMSL